MTNAVKKKFTLYRLCGANIPIILMTALLAYFNYVMGAGLGIAHTLKGSPALFTGYIAYGGYTAVFMFIILHFYGSNIAAAETMPYTKSEITGALFRVLCLPIIIFGIAEAFGLVFEMEMTFSYGVLIETAGFEQGLRSEVFYQTANGLALYISMQLNIAAAALLVKNSRDICRSNKKSFYISCGKWAVPFAVISLLKLLAAMYAIPSAAYIAALSVSAVGATVLSVILAEKSGG